jgi:hypothetical protein
MSNLKYGMDAKQIKEFIQQVAIIDQVGVDVGPNGKPLTGIHKPKKIKIVQEMENEFGEIEEVEIEIPNTNPTLGFEIKKLKDRNAVCELAHIGCGRIVTNQIIDKKLYMTPERHWRTSCRTCQKIVGPTGDTLIQGGLQAQNAYSAWFNNKRDK